MKSRTHLAATLALALIAGPVLAADPVDPAKPTDNRALIDAAVAKGDMAAVEALHGTPEDLGRAYNISLSLKEPHDANGAAISVTGFGVRTVNLRNLPGDRKLVLYDGRVTDAASPKADAAAATTPVACAHPRYVHDGDSRSLLLFEPNCGEQPAVKPAN